MNVGHRGGGAAFWPRARVSSLMSQPETGSGLAILKYLIRDLIRSRFCVCFSISQSDTLYALLDNYNARTYRVRIPVRSTPCTRRARPRAASPVPRTQEPSAPRRLRAGRTAPRSNRTGNRHPSCPPPAALRRALGRTSPHLGTCQLVPSRPKHERLNPSGRSSGSGNKLSSFVELRARLTRRAGSWTMIRCATDECAPSEDAAIAAAAWYRCDAWYQEGGVSASRSRRHASHGGPSSGPQWPSEPGIVLAHL